MVRRWMALGLALFPLALGLVAGFKLSRESLAVVIGVMLGFLSSLPIYILALFFLKKEVRKEEPKPNPYPSSPPVIVINPGGGTRFLPPAVDLGYEPRTFRIIGENED